MKIQISTSKDRGLTLFEVLVVIAALLVLLAVLFSDRILLSGHNQSAVRARRISCVNNLKQVGLRFLDWSIANGDKYPMQISVTNGGTMELVGAGTVFPHFQVMSNEFITPKYLHCPSDNHRHPATNFTSDFNDSRLSYFVGVDAEQTNAITLRFSILSPMMLLSGDRNLTSNQTTLNSGLVRLRSGNAVKWTKEIHGDAGNILMANFAVQQLSQSGLKKVLKSTGTATNRLAMP
jgi:prepilin-type N-terminal cleavage/methylation domain-containing protein